jgi:hypothetical protein
MNRYQFFQYSCKICYYFRHIILPRTELVKMNISDFLISLNAVVILLTNVHFKIVPMLAYLLSDCALNPVSHYNLVIVGCVEMASMLPTNNMIVSRCCVHGIR